MRRGKGCGGRQGGKGGAVAHAPRCSVCAPVPAAAGGAKTTRRKHTTTQQSATQQNNTNTTATTYIHQSQRDPFCLERPEPAAGGRGGGGWTLLLASGLKGRGGAVLVFKSVRLLGGEARIGCGERMRRDVIVYVEGGARVGARGFQRRLLLRFSSRPTATTTTNTTATTTTKHNHTNHKNYTKKAGASRGCSRRPRRRRSALTGSVSGLPFLTAPFGLPLLDY